MYDLYGITVIPYELYDLRKILKLLKGRLIACAILVSTETDTPVKKSMSASSKSTIVVKTLSVSTQ